VGSADPVLAGARDDANVCRGPPVHRAGARSHRRGVLFRRLPQQFVTPASVSAAGCVACSESGQVPRELAHLPRDRRPREPAAQGRMRNPVLASKPPNGSPAARLRSPKKEACQGYSRPADAPGAQTWENMSLRTLRILSCILERPLKSSAERERFGDLGLVKPRAIPASQPCCVQAR